MSSSLPFMAGSPSRAHAYKHQILEKKVNMNESYGFASKSETITVNKDHYESLLRNSQKFENIKRYLLEGGLSQENFNVLANDSSTINSPAKSPKTPLPSNSNRYHQQFATSYNASQSGQKPAYLRSSPGNENEDTLCLEESVEDNKILGHNKNEDQRPLPDEGEQRTVDIRNLPERTTHLDLTNAIRGGALLEIYLRFHDSSARVAFVDAEAARKFLERAKHAGFRIHNQRVDVSWSDRQYYLRPYVRQNIEHGASRKLVIHKINANITATLIREHLEHIHNLIIVDINFDYAQSVVYISTNSVHNAMFARSCMKSRAAYRGMRVEFAPDECARPYANESVNQQRHQHQQGSSFISKKQNQSQQRKQGGVVLPGSSLANRFGALSVESTSTESDDE